MPACMLVHLFAATLLLLFIGDTRAFAAVTKPPYYIVPNVTLNGISPDSSRLTPPPFDNLTRNTIVDLNGSNLMGNYGSGSLKCLVMRESGEQVC